MKKFFALIVLALFLFNLSSVYAQEEHNFTKAIQLIDSKISCDTLTNEQLEEMGDYYMEQMHPGEAHEYMDAMMGGEGSESLKQVHINIAKGIYCNENVGGMMGYGGMMGNTYYRTGTTSFNIFGGIIMFLVIIILVLFIIWLIKQLQKSERGRKN